MNMNSNRKEIKITLWAFGIGFTFSIILGLIVGNPIVISLLRAFLASLLFAIVIFGIIYIVKRYVPELMELTTEIRRSVNENKVDKNETREKGVKVDYIVGEQVTSKSDKDTDKESNNDELKSHPFKDTFAETEESMKRPPEEQTVEEKSLSDKTASEKNEEEELPPIEELLGEEDQDIVPEAEIEEEVISSSEKKIKSDYIEVGDFKIPNEPEIIAKAIKKVMKENE